MCTDLYKMGFPGRAVISVLHICILIRKVKVSLGSFRELKWKDSPKQLLFLIKVLEGLPYLDHNRDYKLQWRQCAEDL